MAAAWSVLWIRAVNTPQLKELFLHFFSNLTTTISSRRLTDAWSKDFPEMKNIWSWLRTDFGWSILWIILSAGSWERHWVGVCCVRTKATYWCFIALIVAAWVHTISMIRSGIRHKKDGWEPPYLKLSTRANVTYFTWDVPRRLMCQCSLWVS